MNKKLIDAFYATTKPINEQLPSRQVERHVRQGPDGERGVVFWRRKKAKVMCLINILEGNWNLPEHPERMNGFANVEDIAEQILGEFGLSKPKNA